MICFYNWTSDVCLPYTHHSHATIKLDLNSDLSWLSHGTIRTVIVPLTAEQEKFWAKFNFMWVAFVD